LVEQRADRSAMIDCFVPIPSIESSWTSIGGCAGWRFTTRFVLNWSGTILPVGWLLSSSSISSVCAEVMSSV
jgi:hypothetical protein